MKKSLLKISIITPSYNQGQFIKKTIDSVLSQKYQNLEYIVMDGGSTDSTLSILRSYGEKIKWFSKKDNGQSDALNKGLRIASGEIVGFINSDDYLLPGSLQKINSVFIENPDIKWLTGRCATVDEKNQEVRSWITLYKNILTLFSSLQLLLVANYISQPATFWRRSLTKEKNIGFFDTNLHYSMDYDYWLKISARYSLYRIADLLACYRVHQHSKAVTSPKKQFETEYAIASKYTTSPVLLGLHKLHFKVALLIYKVFLVSNKV